MSESTERETVPQLQDTPKPLHPRMTIRQILQHRAIEAIGTRIRVNGEWLESSAIYEEALREIDRLEQIATEDDATTCDRCERVFRLDEVVRNEEYVPYCKLCLEVIK